MYRLTLDKKDKGGAIAAVVAIHAALLFALLHLSGTVDLADPQRVLQVINVREVTEPPPPPPQPKQAQKAKAKEKEGGAAPKNIKSEATPVVAPKPPTLLPLPPTIAVSETPREGVARTQGASDVRGPGTGAGGVGTGTGSGAGGNGPGGGGDGGIATRAQPLTRGPRSHDYPPRLRRILASGRSPFVKFTIQPNGRIANCRAYESSGDPELDNATCLLVTRGLVYRPALNRRGEAVASEAFYRQAF
jgi:protein TonB